MVIDQPQVPQDAVLSTKTLLSNMSIFLVVGIFLAIVGIAGGALLDRSLRFPIDVRHGLSLPVLALVPMAKPVILTTTTVEQGAPTPSTIDEGASSDDGSKGDAGIFQPRAS
jgi:uncharacterized membrane protein YccF (DUF307 family)